VLQIVYISTTAGAVDRATLASVLDTSRRNNGRDGISGFLFCDGKRFLQALEGEAAAVETALERIRRDPRHRAVVVLSRREVPAREFGAWAMASADDYRDPALLLERVRALVAATTPALQATFNSFAELRRAA
jgi:hypothetical protein